MHDPSDEILLGKLAILYKYATEPEVREGLRTMRQERGVRGLEEILHEQGVLSAFQGERLRKLYEEQQAKRSRSGAKPQPAAPAVPPQPAAPAWKPSTTSPASLVGVLRTALAVGASDIHLHAGHRLRARIHGRLRDLTTGPVSSDDSARLVDEVLTVEQRRELIQRGQVDFVYALPDGSRFRANTYRQRLGIDAVFRVIPPRAASLEELKLPASLARFATLHQGLVLVTGPAGCGKSSTLAALVDEINRQRDDHVVTVEDPIEVVHQARRALVNQRQVGLHTQSFATGLRAALREDPDVILIGELRDLETTSLALTAAETGHLVLATLHTGNAVRTIDRLVGLFPAAQQAQVRSMLAESLRGVIAQRLLEKADGSGRVPAVEILIADRAVANLIREGKTFQLQSVLQTGHAKGMCLLDDALRKWVEQGVISKDEARRHAEDPSRFAAGAGEARREGGAA